MVDEHAGHDPLDTLTPVSDAARGAHARRRRSADVHMAARDPPVRGRAGPRPPAGCPRSGSAPRPGPPCTWCAPPGRRPRCPAGTSWCPTTCSDRRPGAGPPAGAHRRGAGRPSRTADMIRGLLQRVSRCRTAPGRAVGRRRARDEVVTVGGPLSGLTTRGRCLLAAGMAAALCSVVLNERDLLRVAVFVIALPILVAVLTGRSRVGLHPNGTSSRCGSGRRPGRGRAERLEHRPGCRPVACCCRTACPTPWAAGPRFVIEHLPRHNGIQLRYPVQPTMRGVHHLGPLRAKVTDPFGLVRVRPGAGRRSPG